MNETNESAGPDSSLRVLVVEDEVLIRMLFEDMLEGLGHTIEATTGRIEEAIALARDATCDVAILDVSLNGAEVFPAAKELAARGIPFLFATGFGAPELPEEFRGRLTLQKPFQESQLKSALAQTLRPAQAI